MPGDCIVLVLLVEVDLVGPREAPPVYTHRQTQDSFSMWLVSLFLCVA